MALLFKRRKRILRLIANCRDRSPQRCVVVFAIPANRRHTSILLLLYFISFTSAVEKIARKFPGLIEIPKEDGFSALHLAAFNNHLEIAKVLLLSVCTCSS